MPYKSQNPFKAEEMKLEQKKHQDAYWSHRSKHQVTNIFALQETMLSIFQYQFFVSETNLYHSIPKSCQAYSEQI